MKQTKIFLFTLLAAGMLQACNRSAKAGADADTTSADTFTDAPGVPPDTTANKVNKKILVCFMAIIVLYITIT